MRAALKILSAPYDGIAQAFREAQRRAPSVDVADLYFEAVQHLIAAGALSSAEAMWAGRAMARLARALHPELREVPT